MPDRPLLLFPTHEKAKPERKKSRPQKIHKPSSVQQGEFFTPFFQELQAVFEARRVELEQSSSGADCEQVLVIETIGTIDDFSKAVKKIDGLQWMGELELEEMDPDERFYDESKPNKKLGGRLYFLMTNQQAMTELLSLWELYKQHPDQPFKFGLAKFKNLFKQLKTIRRWDISDRFFETGVLEHWRDQMECHPAPNVRFEAELWYKQDEQSRTAIFTELKRQLDNLGGRLINQYVLDEIAYHGILGELPTNVVQALLDDPSVETALSSRMAELVKLESVKFFNSVGQMSVGQEPFEGDLSRFHRDQQPLPSGNPVVALLDGVPMLNHDQLAGRVVFEDPDGFSGKYQVNEQCHGTAMASLLIHGDLSEQKPAMKTPLYMLPILAPDPAARGIGKLDEKIPDDFLDVDLLHQALKRMAEGVAADISPTAPSIKIINLSIGDSRPFNRELSPLCRLIDWWSHRHGILFIVSAGNHSNDICLEIDWATFEALSPSERESLLVKHCYQNSGANRLRPPSESLNALTIGSIHQDASSGAFPEGCFDPYESNLPSPFSAFGNGYRRAIKPDLVFPGGKIGFKKPWTSSSPITLKPAFFATPPGLQVAAPSLAVGENDRTKFECGTSHATALVSRAGVECIETIEQIFSEQASDIDFQPLLAPLVKAMLAHGCSWNDMRQRLEKTIGPLCASHNVVKSWVSRWMGYGLPDVGRVRECSAQRATILGFGTLAHEEAHIFRLPLPPSLASVTHKRKLTVTLAWLSPIQPKTQKYRSAKLWFDAPNDLAKKREDADHNAVKRGTLQHEVFAGNEAFPFQDGHSIAIQVNCLQDAGAFLSPINYGLAVSLEVAEGVNIPIYDEIKAKIATLVQIQQRVVGR